MYVVLRTGDRVPALRYVYRGRRRGQARWLAVMPKGSLDHLTSWGIGLMPGHTDLTLVEERVREEKPRSAWGR